MAIISWQIRGRTLSFGRPIVLGIVNVTPDSFSDGGQFLDHDAAINHAIKLVGEGADVLDIGGESTRPGAEPVPLDEELRRVVPVVREVARRTGIPISVDTYKAEVARQCLKAGAAVVNDVFALRGDPEMPNVIREFGAGAILMHMQGTPQTMQIAPTYDDVTQAVEQFFEDRLRALTAAGIPLEQLAIDPGIGFGKTTAHTWELLAGLPRLRRFGRPICLGVSRKGFLGKLTGRDTPDRIAARLSVACHAIALGATHIVRTHDVAPTRDAFLVQDMIARSAN